MKNLIRLVQLPANLVDASQQVATGCTRGAKQRNSSFIATARGGIPPRQCPISTLKNWLEILHTVWA